MEKKNLLEMTNEDALTVAALLGGASHLSEEGRIHQVKELMERRYNMQTNIAGVDWYRAWMYLVSKGYDIDTKHDFANDIVHCVNSHPSLVSLVKEMGEALEAAKADIEMWTKDSACSSENEFDILADNEAYAKIRAALIKYKQSQI